MKQRSVFFSDETRSRIARNAERFKYADDMKKQMVEEAEPWLGLSDDDIWRLVFGHTLSRSTQVWFSGYCPTCKKDTPMRTWQTDAFAFPWKVRCPHCKDLYPKNDFQRYYLSGLDRKGIFQRELADPSLLFNTEHPDSSDPLHLFGVDDGEGYVEPETGNRWRFVGNYLLRGQWKHGIVKGLEKLANAYMVTGDIRYARRAGILLDRIADVFPDFDFKKQGYAYAKNGNHEGYVGTHYDVNMEFCSVILSYDKVFEAIRQDEQLVDFLSEKARQLGLDNRKERFEHIQRNIEERIFRHMLDRRERLVLNFPATDTLMLTMRTVLDWHEKKEEITADMLVILKQATAVDGVTGEKGLANYSALVIHKMSQFLALYNLADDRFLADLTEQLPRLKDTYRFFIDTLCLDEYYPLSGDTGNFAEPIRLYRGVWFDNVKKADGGGSMDVRDGNSTEPSMYSYLWNIYKITGDTDYLKIMYKGSNDTLEDGFPYDLTALEPAEMMKEITDAVTREGTTLQQESLNKREWHLAILRSGSGKSGVAAWLDYDSGFTHGHKDGMNLGLFAKGLDLMPDFGYVPVQYEGGWHSPQVKWYGKTAAHNTVAVDRQDTIRDRAGETKLWAAGTEFKAIRASGKEMIDKQQFERTIALVDISADDAYLFDLFRVVGGREHAKFMGSHFGKITTAGLNLQAADDYGHETLMRHFRGDERPEPGWSVDWKIEDYLGLLEQPSDIHLKYTDLTADAAAFTAEAWISARDRTVKDEHWIPRIMVRRQAEQEPLRSNFVGIVEPYEGQSNISRIRRLDLTYSGGVSAPDSDAAVEISLADGRTDLIVSLDTEDPLGIKSKAEAGNVYVQGDWNIVTDSELCFVRKGKAGIEKIVICNGSYFKCGDIELRLQRKTEFLETVVRQGE